MWKQKKKKHDATTKEENKQKKLRRKKCIKCTRISRHFDRMQSTKMEFLSSVNNWKNIKTTCYHVRNGSDLVQTIVCTESLCIVVRTTAAISTISNILSTTSTTLQPFQPCARQVGLTVLTVWLLLHAQTYCVDALVAWSQ